jgi:hypothetical protein
VIVGDKLIPIVRPVAGISIIDPKVNHSYVGSIFQRSLVLLLLDIGAMTTGKKCSSRLSKVAHLIARAQELLKDYGVGLSLTILE